MTGLPTSTVTRVLDRLEQAGYIRRSDDPSDRRKVRIELVTDKIDAIAGQYDQYTDVLDGINTEFTEKELGVIARYLERSSATFSAGADASARLSSWSMTNDDEHAWYISGAARSGAFVDPLPFFDERARPHPLATLLQASTLTGAWRSVPVEHYVEATGWPGESPMAAMTARCRADDQFAVHHWDTTHNVPR